METENDKGLASFKIYPIAVALGAGVGLVISVFLWAITHLKDALWPHHGHNEKVWLVAAVCILGGLVVGALNHVAESQRQAAHEFSEALADAHQAETNAPPSAMVIVGRSALGIASLGFGAPLGPEAPILALVSQMSARLAAVLRISRAQAVHITVSGALGALFAAPLASAALDHNEVSNTKIDRIKSMGPEILAGATALLTFVKLLPDSESHPFEVHGDVAPGFGINLLWCAVAAVLAAGVGRIAQELIPRVRSFAVTRLPGGALALGLVSGSVLAISAMVTPIILFSGHHETQSLLDGSHSTMALVGLAFLKVIVVVACLAGGWYGGQIFPIAFVGAAIALAFGQLVHSPSTLALTAAGYVAANVVTLRKPLLVVIIFIFFFPPTAWLAMVIAAGIAVAFTSDEAPATSH